jgi:hypothetical protein
MEVRHGDAKHCRGTSLRDPPVRLAVARAERQHRFRLPITQRASKTLAASFALEGGGSVTTRLHDKARMSGARPVPSRADGLDAVRRVAALVVVVVAFVVPVWYIATLIVVGTYRDNYVPGVGARDQEFVQFYVDNFSKIRLTSTMFIIGWILILVLLVSVVRVFAPRVRLAGIVAVTLAGASTAVSVASQGLFTYPTLVPELTADKLPANLDPEVARFIVLSTEAIQNAGGVLLGVALLMVALLAAQSDLWGHRFIAVIAALMGIVGTLNMVVGGAGTAVFGMIPFGIITGLVLLRARRRLGSPGRAPGELEAG